MSSFKFIAIAEGRRECRRPRGDGGRWVGDGLLGGVTILEQEEREELAEGELWARNERVGTVFESGKEAELGGRRVLLEGGVTGILDAEVGMGYSYRLDRSKQYGVPTKSVLSSSLEHETSFDEFEGIGTGMATGTDRDIVLVITTWRVGILAIAAVICREE